MNQQKLVRQVYLFKKKFAIYSHKEETEGKSTIPIPYQPTEIKLELHINFESQNFYINMNDALAVEKELIHFPATNCFGGFANNANALVDFYGWLREITEFANDKLLNSETKQTKAISFEQTIETKNLLIDFLDFLDDRHELESNFTYEKIYHEYMDSLKVESIPSSKLSKGKSE